MKASALALAMIAPAAAFAAAEAPAGSTPAQQKLVTDWAQYATACRGGAVSGAEDTTWGYCGTANYLLLQLSNEGICMDDAADNYFRACQPGEKLEDPMASYPF